MLHHQPQRSPSEGCAYLSIRRKPRGRRAHLACVEVCILQNLCMTAATEKTLKIVSMYECIDFVNVTALRSALNQPFLCVCRAHICSESKVRRLRKRSSRTLVRFRDAQCHRFVTSLARDLKRGWQRAFVNASFHGTRWHGDRTESEVIHKSRKRKSIRVYFVNILKRNWTRCRCWREPCDAFAHSLVPTRYNRFSLHGCSNVLESCVLFA